MNRFEQPDKPSESIRSEINETRQRMDSTIDALTERLRGRHLVDELLGLLRSGNGSTGASAAATNVKNKVAETTSAATHAIVDAVKAHPIPVLVMGAGLAWLIYERERAKHGSERSYSSLDPEPRRSRMSEDLPSSEFEDYTPGYGTTGVSLAGSEVAGSDVGSYSGNYSTTPGYRSTYAGSAYGESDEPGLKERVRGRAGEAKQRIQGKAAELGARAREGIQHLKDSTAQATAQVRGRTRELAGRTREQVSRAAQEHPLETGLTCLAIGLLAGLLTPTPQRVRDEVAPVAERLKQRAREAGGDIVARGKRVVAAATDAAKHEAEAQQLTPEAMLHRNEQRGRGSDRDRGRSGDRAQEGREMAHPGDYPGQTAASSPPTPAAKSAMSGDEQRVAGDIVQPRPVPPQPTI